MREAARSSPWAAAVIGGAATLTALRALDRRPPGGAERWRRTNFRGREVDLLAGPAAVAGALATAALVGRSGDPGPLVVATVAGGLGLYDDLAGSEHARGLRGHLRALREGRITTGLVKMAGLAGAGVAAALLSSRRRDEPAVLVLVDAAVISGTANLVNLLDLRPGRALKSLVVVALPLVGRRDVAGVTGSGVAATALCLLPDDLGERRMLGDCGANTLGALAGWALVERTGPAARLLTLSGVVGLTLLSERVSFSAVIDRSPTLGAVDRWGRQPS